MENENKLPPEFKAKWVEALRSGEYKQGKKVMYNQEDDSLCCLGVAGILCGLTKEEMSYVTILSNHHSVTGKQDVITRKALELGYPKLILAGHKHNGIAGTTLAEMNDEGKSFSEIADYIEANL